MKLKYPLTDALPSTENARDRLLAKIFEYRRTSTDKELDDEDFALLYNYGMFPQASIGGTFTHSIMF
jgi:hypothetical protein